MQSNPHTGEMNDDNEVVFIRPPRAGATKRTDLFVSVFNEDTVDIALDLYLFDGTFKQRIFKGTIVPDGRFTFSSKDGENYELDRAKSVRGVLGGSVTTSQPRWYSNWRES